ncbi:MAG: LD-carboxypeptidase [Ileibacterium sp.]|nr:LD-carboxypeptidase [Ileibacterium sp.]
MKILLCALSDPLHDSKFARKIKSLLEEQGFEADLAGSTLHACQPKERAEEVNAAFNGGEYEWVLDISGGDLANEVLPFLDYEGYAQSEAYFAGFSDLTCVVNALYAKTGKEAVLFPIGYQSDLTKTAAFLRGEDESALEIKSFWDEMEGNYWIGGNMRCFLKLAGTPYFPVCEKGTLVLEGYSTSINNFYSMMAHLGQIGVFEQVDEILFGRFQNIESQIGLDSMMDFYKQAMEILGLEEMCWGFAPEFGHIQDCPPLIIGDGRDEEDE